MSIFADLSLFGMIAVIVGATFAFILLAAITIGLPLGLVYLRARFGAAPAGGGAGAPAASPRGFWWYAVWVLIGLGLLALAYGLIWGNWNMAGGEIGDWDWRNTVFGRYIVLFIIVAILIVSLFSDEARTVRRYMFGVWGIFFGVIILGGLFFISWLGYETVEVIDGPRTETESPRPSLREELFGPSNEGAGAVERERRSEYVPPVAPPQSIRRVGEVECTGDWRNCGYTPIVNDRGIDIKSKTNRGCVIFTTKVPEQTLDQINWEPTIHGFTVTPKHQGAVVTLWVNQFVPFGETWRKVTCTRGGIIRTWE